MRKLLIFLLAAIMVVVVGGCQQGKPGELVLVKGGAFVNTKSSYYGKSVIVSDFYIGKYEVTQKEWRDIMGSNPSTFKGDGLPVETVSWYECVEYCNIKSIKGGLSPYYTIDKTKKDPHNMNDGDDLKWTITINPGANGYRLPTETEWEYAADGGQLSKSYAYSGSDNLNEVGWYWKNSGDKALDGYWNYAMIEKNNAKTKPVGGKAPNELGLYDLSGNVREWCWDWHEQSNENDFQGRVWRGGGWLGGEQACESSFRNGNWGANDRGNDSGFRVCRGE